MQKKRKDQFSRGYKIEWNRKEKINFQEDTSKKGKIECQRKEKINFQEDTWSCRDVRLP